MVCKIEFITCVIQFVCTSLWNESVSSLLFWILGRTQRLGWRYKISPREQWMGDMVFYRNRECLTRYNQLSIVIIMLATVHHFQNFRLCMFCMTSAPCLFHLNLTASAHLTYLWVVKCFFYVNYTCKCVKTLYYSY